MVKDLEGKFRLQTMNLKLYLTFWDVQAKMQLYLKL